MCGGMCAMTVIEKSNMIHATKLKGVPILTVHLPDFAIKFENHFTKTKSLLFLSTVCFHIETKAIIIVTRVFVGKFQINAMQY